MDKRLDSRPKCSQAKVDVFSFCHFGGSKVNSGVFWVCSLHLQHRHYNLESGNLAHRNEKEHAHYDTDGS